MTDGNPISGPAPRREAPTVGALEAAFQDLHEHLRRAQDEAQHLDRARERAIEAGLEALGSEVLWPETSRHVSIEWEPRDHTDFGTRLQSKTDDLEAALGEFLDGGDYPDGLPSTVRRMDARAGEIKEWDVEEWLQQIKAGLLRTKEERATQVRSLRSDLDDSWHRAVETLRAWVRSPTRTAPENWGRIQLAWRTALGLPGTKAAEILGVSAPAITRYEKGSRLPSLAYIESMVERIVSYGAEPSPQAAAIFLLAESYEMSAAELLASLEADTDREHEIREHATSLLDSLPIDDVKLLVELARSREALSALRALPVEDRLAPLRRAVSALDRRDA